MPVTTACIMSVASSWGHRWKFPRISHLQARFSEVLLEVLVLPLVSVDHSHNCLPFLHPSSIYN